MVCERHVEVCKRDSDNSLKAVPNTLNICYSKEERTKLDVFGEDLPYDSYILMYVHGGYWQLLSKELSSYVVEPLYKNGFVTVIVGYTLAPKELAKNFPSLKALIVAGENDSPEFKRQSKQYCQALVGKGIDSIYEEEKEVDHFNLVENLSDENYHMTIEIIQFVKSF
ncbi:Kynurenine formamidase [Armadillidium vulgare]|nr:Kynurenine formamidase [Armadillidium vulgare]